MGGGMEVTKSRFIAEWSTSREILEFNFPLDPPQPRHRWPLRRRRAHPRLQGHFPRIDEDVARPARKYLRGDPSNVGINQKSAPELFLKFTIIFSGALNKHLGRGNFSPRIYNNPSMLEERIESQVKTRIKLPAKPFPARLLYPALPAMSSPSPVSSPPPPPNSILSPPPPPNSGLSPPPPPNSGSSPPPPPNSGSSPPPPPDSGSPPMSPPPFSPPPTTPPSSPPQASPPLPPALPPSNPPTPAPSSPPGPTPTSPPQPSPVTPPASPPSSPPPPPIPSSPPPPPPIPSSPPRSPPVASSPPPPPITTSSPPPPPITTSSPPPPIASSPPPPRTPVIPPPPSSTPVSPPPPPVRLSPPPPTGSPPPPATPSVSQPPPPPSKSSSSSTAVIVGGVAAAAVAIALLLGIFFFFCWRRRRRSPTPSPSAYADDPHGPYHTPSPAKVTSSGATPPPTTRRESGSHYSGPDTKPSSPGIFLNFAKTSFTYEELEMATDGFSEANLLGRGGFGQVYRGTFDGKEFAVKKLTFGSGQGDREFLAEVEKLSRVHHKHLVSLIGYCISGSQRMLVYEYLPNNTLEFHLHGKGQPVLEWPIRFKIAVGSAKGLAYLHEDCRPKIIHRDIKAANILLDSNFEAKVSDFGLAKFQVEGDTHISTRVMGTFGYLAPEYAVSGKLTDKSDVFSMGVMMLELITGRRPVFSSQSYMDETLVGWARPLLAEAAKDGNYEALVDPRLENNHNPNEMSRLVACAAACVRQSARLRPRMGEVVRFLQGELSLDVLHGEVLPGYSVLQSSSSQEYMSRLRRMAFANQEGMTSGMYSVPSTSSEFNRNLDSSSFDYDPYDREITDSNKSTGEFSAKT